MDKTTVYLPADLKRALRLTAERRRISEAELIREGVALVTARQTPPPTLPLFESGRPDLAENVDDALVGFGHR